MGYGIIAFSLAMKLSLKNGQARFLVPFAAESALSGRDAAGGRG